MKCQYVERTGRPCLSFLGLVVSLAVVLQASSASAQTNNNNNNRDGLLVATNRAVGGVLVAPNGMLTSASVVDRRELFQQISQSLERTPQGMDAKVPMRKISLRRLDEALGENNKNGQPLSDAAQLLGGLQSIRYIVADPEANDIYLVGPAEAWKPSDRGAIVGQTTNRPVLLLDDLITVLRASNTSTPEVITCSIDPTESGLARLQAYTAQNRPVNPEQTAAAYRELLGPQAVTVTGIPSTSHFARVLVAADYKMKRIGMAFDPSPLPQLPSFLNMTQGGNLLPRWWLTPNIDTILHDEEKLTWDLRGAQVKAMTESEYLDASGQRHRTDRTDVSAQRWADLMTEHYDALSLQEPIFGQLRNCMDLAVVAAVLVKERLPQRVGVELPNLLGGDAYEPVRLPAPTAVATDSSIIRKTRGWVVGCGGVEINPWALVDNSQVSPSLTAIRERAQFTGDTWWSN